MVEVKGSHFWMGWKGNALARPVAAAVAIAGRVAAMQRGTDHRWPLSRRSRNILHKIDLAGIWPADAVDVCAQRPIRRPNARANRQLHARFQPPVFVAALVL